MLTNEELRILAEVLVYSLHTLGNDQAERDLLNKINAMLDKAEKV